MTQSFQRVIAVVLAFAILLTPSANAEKRSPGRTAAQLEADMARVFGPPRTGVAPAGPAASRHRASLDPILDAMNRERATRGLEPLRLNERLSLAARDRIDDMFAKRYFAHVSPDGIEPFVWAKRHGYRYRIIGENLAVGYRGTAVVDGWMRSPGHRDNILQRSFDEVGIAIADGSPRHGYRGPTVVAMYGSR
jgi:uncharacterized protein YkwD